MTTFVINACHEIGQINHIIDLPTSKKQDSTINLFFNPSKLENSYRNFNSPKAIKTITKIENEYFSKIDTGYSKYYGTMWAKDAHKQNYFNSYLNQMSAIGELTDSMHCTIYAMRALEAGLGSKLFDSLTILHKRIYKEHEYAGWSVSHILVAYFGWKACLVLDSTSKEFKRCVTAYKNRKEYKVWYQPDIPIDHLYFRNKDEGKIDSLLSQYEFGWGFSEQGWHTWITNFHVLKECYWGGAPSVKDKGFDGIPLFLKKEFKNYDDYQSHVITFPPI